jgi:hypothetical protein
MSHPRGRIMKKRQTMMKKRVQHGSSTGKWKEIPKKRAIYRLNSDGYLELTALISTEEEILSLLDGLKPILCQELALNQERKRNLRPESHPRTAPGLKGQVSLLESDPAEERLLNAIRHLPLLGRGTRKSSGRRTDQTDKQGNQRKKGNSGSSESPSLRYKKEA